MSSNATFLNHCVKSVRIRSYSDPYFPAFGLNTERSGVSLLIQYKCRKIRTRITPNTDTFLIRILVNISFVVTKLIRTKWKEWIIRICKNSSTWKHWKSILPSYMMGISQEMDHNQYTKFKWKVKNRTWFSGNIEQVVVIENLGGSAKVSAQSYNNRIKTAYIFLGQSILRQVRYNTLYNWIITLLSL